MLQAGPGVVHQLPSEAQALVIDAFAWALHVTFLAVIPVAALGFIAVLFLRELPLRRTRPYRDGDDGRTRHH